MQHLRTIIVFVMVLCLDMVSKVLFYDKALGADISLLSPHFNTGIARSVPIPLWLIIVMTTLVIGVLCFLYYKKELSRWIFALLSGGAIANMYDRIMLGGVRDFIDFGWFPVFNIADVAISIAGLVIIVSILFPGKFGIKE